MGEDWLYTFAVIGAVLLGIFLLLFALSVLLMALVVAGALFVWSTQHGFVGVALYVILWIIAAPVMIVICLIGGLVLAVAWSYFASVEWSAEASAAVRRSTHRFSAIVVRLKAWQGAWRGLPARRDESPGTRPQPGSPDYLDWANRRGKWADRS